MEIMEVIALLCLVIVVGAGIIIKRHTRRALSEIDGLGTVAKQSDDNEIARF